MIHYTLNTQHSRLSPRDEVANSIIEMLQPIIRGDEERVEPFRVLVTREPGCALVSVYSADQACPTVMFGVALNDDAAETVWPILVRTYNALPLPFRGKAAARPVTTPWCAAILLPPRICERPEALMMLGDFERCVAWAIIEDENRARRGAA